MRSLLRSTLRRSLLAVSITQLVMSSLAPLHELRTVVDRGTLHVERVQTSGGTPAHNPDTCAVCRFSAAPFTTPVANTVTTTAAAPLAPAPGIAIVAPTRSIHTAHQTRAPPAHLA